MLPARPLQASLVGTAGPALIRLPDPEPEGLMLAGPGDASGHPTNAARLLLPSDQGREAPWSLRPGTGKARTPPPRDPRSRPASSAHRLPLPVLTSHRPTFLVWTSMYTSCSVSSSHMGHPHPCFSLMTAWTSNVLGRKRAEEEAGLSRLPPGGPDTGLGGCWALSSGRFQVWDEPATAHWSCSFRDSGNRGTHQTEPIPRLCCKSARICSPDPEDRPAGNRTCDSHTDGVP